ncbi:MAG: hypothetical protein HWD61_08930 [Parachlamydiaceae bacterium]|nr:MAG: hypothetical protein HWD61_08930 [Parachlamydiaceae bacterium]
MSKATPALWGPEKAQKYINREIASLIPGSDEEVSLTPLKIFQSNQFDTIAFYKNGITAFLGNFFCRSWI